MTIRSTVAALALLALLALLIHQEPLTASAQVVPTCTTDAATKKITCTATQSLEAGAVYDVTGQAVNAAGQRVTFSAIAPACERALTTVSDGTLTVTWTCMEGFSITFTIIKRP